MKSRKAISTWAIAVIAIIVIAAIAGIAYYMNTSHKPVTTSQVITINFYDDLAPSEANYTKNVIIPEFEALHPNIKIHYIDMNADDMVKTIESLAKGGDVGPTVIAEDNLVIGELLYGGYLMDLSPYMSNITSNVTFISSMVKLMNYEQKVYGGVYFIPFRGNLPLVWYNKTVFNQLGLTPPQTWDELLQDAKVIYEKTGKLPIMFQGGGGASTYTELYQWMVQAGGNPFLFNDSGDVYAFQYLYNLSQYFYPGYVHGYWGSYKGLGDGEYYILHYQWPYIYSTMQSEGYNVSNIGFYPGPKGPANNDVVIGGDVLAIPKGATNIPYLIEFIEFLLSPKVQQQFIVALGWPVVNELAYKNLPSNISSLYQVELQAYEHSFFRLPVPWITEWGSIADQVFEEIIVKHAPYSQIPQILSRANAEMYQYLKTYYNQTVADEYEQGMFGPLYA